MSGKNTPRPRTVAILTYHSLDDSGSVFSTPPRLFVEQMGILHELGTRVIPLADIPHVLSGAAPSDFLVAITFDDGFRSVYEYGLPILQRYGFPATVFVVTDYCGKTNSWPSQPRYVEPRPLLSWAEVKEMCKIGISLGSHTRTHPDLRTVANSGAEEELVASKKAIEDAIGRPVEALAYPYGTYNEFVKDLAQEHFRLAVGTTLGFAGAGSDLFALERLDMYYLRRPVLFRRLFSRELHSYIRLRRGVRDLRGRVPRWINGLISWHSHSRSTF